MKDEVFFYSEPEGESECEREAEKIGGRISTARFTYR